MVDRKSSRQRRAIAMVELIFALVIIGIVLMSAPSLIQQSIRSGSVALQQEAIAAAASQTAIVLSMHWDENNNSNLAGVSPMLDVDRTPFDFNITNEPQGLVGVTGRNSIYKGETLPATAPIDFGMDPTADANTTELDYTDFDDVDDYFGSTFGLIVFNNEVTSADVGDYVDVNITMGTDVNYAEDNVVFSSTVNDADISDINNAPLGVATNIKFVRVNLTSNSGVEELDKNITLEAFSSNIGTSLPEGEEEL